MFIGNQEFVQTLEQLVSSLVNKREKEREGGLSKTWLLKKVSNYNSVSKSGTFR